MNFTWFDKQIVYITKTVEFFLVGLIAWLLVGLVLDTLPKGTMFHSEQTTDVDAKGTFPLQSLVDAALFGKEPAKEAIIVPKIAPPPKPAVKVVKPLKLVLQLNGVIYAGQESVAFIVAKPGDKQAIFRTGDEISTDVMLKRIAIDSIYVESQGQEQQVWIAFATINQTPDALQQPDPMAASSMPPVMTNRQHGRAMVQGSPQRVVRQVSRQMLNAELKDFSKLLMQAQVLPHMQNGKPDGFIINNIAAGSLYQKIGLMNGDVIQMVNGVPIRSMEQAMTLYQQLRTAPQIEISVLRQGQVQHIQFNIQ